jgi:hypothetical protein
MCRPAGVWGISAPVGKYRRWKGAVSQVVSQEEEKVQEADSEGERHFKGGKIKLPKAVHCLKANGRWEGLE